MHGKKIQLDRQDALLIIDVQNDFLPGGSLAVPEGNKVIEPLNSYIALFRSADLPIYATRDWHPLDHCSFQAQGGPWPVHCLAGSHGAQFASSLRLPKNTVVIDKDTEAEKATYSAFIDTNLADTLRRQQTSRLFVGGLATDYCVRLSVLDALREGFQVMLLLDAIRAVNVKPEDGQRAIDLMTAKGARAVNINQVNP